MKQRAAFLNSMREQLLARQREIMELLEQQGEREEAGMVRDSADEASSSTMAKLQSSLEQSEVDEMRLIDEALERMEHGEYGICVNCNEPISAKRLEIFPYAARCIACQEALES